MLIVPKYSGSELGYSFALALTSACLVLLLTFFLCYAACKSKKNDDDDGAGYQGGGSTAVANYQGGAAAPYGGGPSFHVQAARVQQAAVVHDPESGGFLMVVRQFNFIRLVHNVSGQND